MNAATFFVGIAMAGAVAAAFLATVRRHRGSRRISEGCCSCCAGCVYASRVPGGAVSGGCDAAADADFSHGQTAFSAWKAGAPGGAMCCSGGKADGKSQGSSCVSAYQAKDDEQRGRREEISCDSHVKRSPYVG